jgi:hypothetical protein
MMQKFLICAGAVNVLSAKLLMGISWAVYEAVYGHVQRIHAGWPRHISAQSRRAAHD